MRVVVIPEDFRKDQYVLQPLLQALFTAVGFPRAKIVLCKDPFIQGISQAMNRKVLHQVLERYSGMADLFLLCVDRDGNSTRQQALDDLEAEADQQLGSHQALLAENAWQELEVWVLAGQTDLPASWDWKEIRRDENPKERYFEPYARSRGLADHPGGGRKVLGMDAGRRYDRVRQLCPEDVARLEARISAWLEVRKGC